MAGEADPALSLFPNGMTVLITLAEDDQMTLAGTEVWWNTVGAVLMLAAADDGAATLSDAGSNS